MRWGKGSEGPRSTVPGSDLTTIQYKSSPSYPMTGGRPCEDEPGRESGWSWTQRRSWRRGGGVVRRRPREMANISDERMRKRKINRGLDDQLGDDGRARRWQREMSCEKEMESGERSVRRVWFF
jgi:hypothetical protein